MDYSQIRYTFGVLNRRSQAYITDACRPWRIGYSEYARCVKSLEEKGYVRRRQDEKDKRFKYIYLTEQGQQARDGLLHISEVWIQALTRNMDERMLASTLQGLQQAAQNAAVLTWDARDGEMEG